MKVTINGELRDLEAARNVAEVIALLDIPAQAVLVEHNGVALRREEWQEQPVAADDRFEIIRIVAGG